MIVVIATQVHTRFPNGIEDESFNEIERRPTGG
jgi:hypothetical protein